MVIFKFSGMWETELKPIQEYLIQIGELKTRSDGPIFKEMPCTFVIRNIKPNSDTAMLLKLKFGHLLTDSDYKDE